MFFVLQVITRYCFGHEDLEVLDDDISVEFLILYWDLVTSIFDTFVIFMSCIDITGYAAFSMHYLQVKYLDFKFNMFASLMLYIYFLSKTFSNLFENKSE
jgi:hypothetical protein